MSLCGGRSDGGVLRGRGSLRRTGSGLRRVSADMASGDRGPTLNKCLARRDPMREDSRMLPSPDPAALPNNVIRLGTPSVDAAPRPLENSDPTTQIGLGQYHVVGSANPPVAVGKCDPLQPRPSADSEVFRGEGAGQTTNTGDSGGRSLLPLGLSTVLCLGFWLGFVVVLYILM